MNTGQTGRPRKHPPAKVGDTFGDRTVTKLMPRDSTSNERVEWKCKCGVWGVSYVFNLRGKVFCRHGSQHRSKE